MGNSRWLLLFFVLAFTSCAKKITETGMASFYGDGYHGRKTANGETFNKRKLTAAHKTLPFGTVVKVLINVNSQRLIKHFPSVPL